MNDDERGEWREDRKHVLLEVERAHDRLDHIEERMTRAEINDAVTNIKVGMIAFIAGAAPTFIKLILDLFRNAGTHP